MVLLLVLVPCQGNPFSAIWTTTIVLSRRDDAYSGAFKAMTSPTRSNLLFAVLGTLGALAFLAAISGTLSTPESFPKTLTLTTSADKEISPSRFFFNSTVTVRVCANTTINGAVCVLALERSGAWLGDVHQLAPLGPRCWSLQLRADKLSASRFGPLWLVALAHNSPAEGCAPIGHLETSTKGSEQPLEALSEALRTQTKPLEWGAERVYVHDVFH